MTLAEAIARRFSSDAYRQLEQGASLKGLLKPFKGKGELLQLAETVLCLRDQVAGLMRVMLAIVAQPPFSLLDLRLVVQHSSAGTDFLRWRSRDFSCMGAEVWQQAMEQPQLVQSVRAALHQLEVNRVTLNLQMSCLHSLYRQATAAANKLQAAEVIFETSHSPTEEQQP
ncbi:MAG: DUF3158 family protein [Pseudomonas sp.]